MMQSCNNQWCIEESKYSGEHAFKPGGQTRIYKNGNLVHISAEKKHIGFHPAPTAILAFQAELSEYRCSKGTIQLPLEKPLPLDLIRKIVLFRVAEQKSLYEAKQAGTPTKKELRPRHPIPSDVTQRLQQEGLTEKYNSRPPYQQNDYIG